MNEVYDSRHNSAYIRLFPLACFIHALLVGLHLLAGTAQVSEILAHEGHYGFDLSVLGNIENRLAGIPALMLSIPVMLIWGALWSFWSWRIGSRLWTAIIVLVTLSWNVIFIIPNRWAIGIALIIGLAIGASGMGSSLYRLTPRNVGGSTARSSAVLITLGTLFLCLSMVRFQLFGANGTDFGILVVFWVILVLPLLLVFSWLFGYVLPQVWVNGTGLQGNPSSLILWLPIIALVPVLIGMNVFLDNTVDQFRTTVLPRFIGYIDSQVVHMPLKASKTISFAGNNLMKISYRYSAKDGLLRSFDIIVPANWTETQGLRPPVEVNSIECEVTKLPMSEDISNALNAVLVDHASVVELLRAIGAGDKVISAKWNIGPRDYWLEPHTYKQDSRYPSWITECEIGGLPITVSVFSGGRFLAQPSEQYRYFRRMRSREE